MIPIGGWISAISTWIRQITPHHNGSYPRLTMIGRISGRVIRIEDISSKNVPSRM